MRTAVATVAVVCSIVLVGASSASANAPGKAHKLPKDACALLTDAQVSPLVPSATPQPQPGTATQVSCYWSGSGTSLAVSVSKVKSAAAAKTALKTSAKAAGVKSIKGVGSFAYASATKFLTHVGALVGPLQLSIDFSPGHAPTAADTSQAVSIAKKVAKKV